MSCLSFEELFAWAHDQLPATVTEHIRIHLSAGCKLCRQEFDQVQKMLDAAACPEFIQPPDWLIEQALDVIAQHQLESHENPVSRVPTYLLADSFAQATLAGVRTASLMSRQMIYRAGMYDINLSINYVSQTRSINLTGRTLPLSADPATVSEADVRLLKGSTVVSATKINQVGMFTFQGIEQGVYDLKISLEDDEIDITGLKAIVCSPPSDTIH